jgi:hypothetical protein
MGIIRKALSGSAALATNGMSLLFFQFRSDTERNTREIKRLRKQNQSFGGGSGMSGQPESRAYPVVHSVIASVGTDALELSLSVSDERPLDDSPGWKRRQSSPGIEQFWNGAKWTSATRKLTS